MPASVLVPLGPRVHRVTAERTVAGGRFEIPGVGAARVQPALAASDLRLPTGRFDVMVEPPTRSRGVELAVALAVLLAAPAHRLLRLSGLVAFGGIDPDGSLRSCPAPAIADLPGVPWVGRFWGPEGRVPEPDESAILTIFDVPDLAAAWGVVLALPGLVGRLAAEFPATREHPARGQGH